MSSRRSSLPGAAELFRSTGTARERSAPEPQGLQREAQRDPQDRVRSSQDAESGASAVSTPPREPTYELDETPPGPRPVRRRARSTGERRPSGRERHDEKITVYVSPEELMDLEHARLTLRGDHGLAVDRGRIVREALAVVIADLEAKGESSILVRRLRGL